jgi:membrane protein
MRKKNKRVIGRWSSEKYSHASTLFLRPVFLLTTFSFIILSLARLFILIYHRNEVFTSISSIEILLYGALRDLEVLATFLFPLLLFPLFYLFSHRKFPTHFVRILWCVVATLILSFIFLATLTDFFYFSSYHSHFPPIFSNIHSTLLPVLNFYPTPIILFAFLFFVCIVLFFNILLLRHPNRAKYPSYFKKRFLQQFILISVFLLFASGLFSSLLSSTSFYTEISQQENLFISNALDATRRALFRGSNPF